MHRGEFGSGKISSCTVVFISSKVVSAETNCPYTTGAKPAFVDASDHRAQGGGHTNVASKRK